MNPTTIIAILTLLETIGTQIAGAVTAIKSAQASGVDLTPDQVNGFRDAANAALAQLDADVKAAQAGATGIAPPPAPPPATPPVGSGG